MLPKSLNKKVLATLWFIFFFVPVSAFGIPASCKRTGFPRFLLVAETGYSSSRLTSGDGAEDEQRFFSRDDGVGERRIRRLMRKIFFARKKPQERAALL